MSKDVKTLYHSELLELSPVTVTVRSGVQESKFKKGSYYVNLTVGGRERAYTIENDSCAEFLESQKGRTLDIIAEGSREEAIIYQAGDQNDPAPSQPYRPPTPTPKPTKQFQTPHEAQQAPQAAPAPAARTTPAPTPRDTEAGVLKAKQMAARLANLGAVAYAAATYMKNEVRETHGVELSEQTVSSFAMNFMIEMERSGMQHAMPVKSMNGAATDPK